MAKRIVRRRDSARLREELAMAEALEPIQDAHAEAKETYEDALKIYRRAVVMEDREAAERALAAVREAKKVLLPAANRLNETRTWLRRERTMVRLQNVAEVLERRLAKPILVKHGSDAREDSITRAELQGRLERARADLEGMSADAAMMRRELKQLAQAHTMKGGE